MSKYLIERSMLHYSVENEIETSANDVFSFRADSLSDDSYWCGFYDSCSERYIAFSSEVDDEMYSITLDVVNEESLSDLEKRLSDEIDSCFDKKVILTKVADDRSIMNEMKWA